VITSANLGAAATKPFTSQLTVIGRPPCLHTHCPWQVGGVEEDRVNKPHRPIPSGLLSMSGAVLRLVVCSIAMCMLAWSGGVLWHGVALQLLLVLHYQLGWDSHWFTKHLWNGITGAVALSSSGHMVGNFLHHQAAAVDAISIMLGAMIALTVAVQDFRDVEGDTAVGRLTLPVAIGDTAARSVTSGFILLVSVLWPAFVCFHLSPCQFTGTAVQLLLGLQGLLACLLSWHIMAPSHRRWNQDRYTFAGYVVLVVCWLFTPVCLPL